MKGARSVGFVCKMCGEMITSDDGTGVCECEHCGSRQTVPLRYAGACSEEYNRACGLFNDGVFDGAENIFSKLACEVPDEPEGYWGKVLCRCGAEYMDDPVTGMKTVRCGRTGCGDITADKDYLEALRLANEEQETIYRREAAALEMLRRDRIEREGNGEEYDVFICCRTSDEEGRSTADSLIAGEIYRQLIDEGFSVFYAPETLKDCSVTDPEPYINAAISGAKAMLIAAAEESSLTVTRVKGEWSRCIAAVRKNSGKKLTVCLENVSREALPAELKEFPVKDVASIGFMSEVIREIRACTGGEGSHAASKNSPEKLLRRLNIFLAEEDFEAAEEYSRLILDAVPDCWQAHYGKFLAYNGCRSGADLLSEEVLNSFAADYVEQFGYDLSDDEFFCTHINEIFGGSIGNALRYSKGEEGMKLRTMYERFLSGIRDAVFSMEQEKIGEEEKAELDELRRRHEAEEEKKNAAKQKKQSIRQRFLVYAAVIFTVLIILAVRFHSAAAIALIILMIVVTVMVLKGLEK